VHEGRWLLAAVCGPANALKKSLNGWEKSLSSVSTPKHLRKIPTKKKALL
jgi:hypothetical protein